MVRALCNLEQLDQEVLALGYRRIRMARSWMAAMLEVEFTQPIEDVRLGRSSRH